MQSPGQKNKAYYIFISYHNYAFGYDGTNSKLKDIVITFWEDMGNYALLKDYTTSILFRRKLWKKTELLPQRLTQARFAR